MEKRKMHIDSLHESVSICPSITWLVLKSTGKFNNSKDGGYHVSGLKVIMN